MYANMYNEDRMKAAATNLVSLDIMVNNPTHYAPKSLEQAS